MSLARARSVIVVAAAQAVLLVYGASAGTGATVGTITVGQAANASQRMLHHGDRLVVRLPSNPSTGYAWTVRSDTRPTLSLTGRSYVPPGDDGRVGASGTAVLRFRAAATGMTVLRLSYARAWEKGVPPARTFTLTVRVA